VREYQHYIGGQWTSADRLFDDLDPYRGSVMARVPAGTRADAAQLPLGGVKDSGWGRSGPHSLADFTELQWITTRDGTGAYPI
jgi:acyl-CoA reductase-like NAD-dependent aldehyde dehydrogenase